MEKFDILVVGMGPAGSSAALTCAKAGLDVIGIEKRQEIGSPKRCGEGLSKSALKRMGIKLPDQAICNTIYGARVYAPNKKFLTINFKKPEGWIIERKIFDKELARMACSAGANVYAKTELIDVRREGKKVIAKLKNEEGVKEIETKIVIACDGIESKVARILGIDTTIALSDIASCVQFEMTGIDIDSKIIQLWFGNKLAPGGYVWCFPKGPGWANIGIGVRRPWAEKPALTYLKAFIESQPNLRGSIIEINSGGVPVGALLKNMVADNLLIAGDAAHQVNPIHGGGIAEAWLGGKLAAQIAVKAVKCENTKARFLSQYNKLWWAERGKRLEKLLKLRKVVERLTDNDFNWLAEYLKPSELIALAEAGGIANLAKLLMKRPKLIALARKLLI
jgi:digeranylgeranylglycerophospholipid reductase